MKKIIVMVVLCCNCLMAYAFGTVQEIRTFPANTYFGTIQAINLPQLKIEEIPSGVSGKMLGMFLLDDKVVAMSPATVIRDQLNNNHTQGYILDMYKKPVAIQPDFQNRAWVIWELTPQEVEWVKDKKLNYWK